MKKYIEQINKFIPTCVQEEKDKELILEMIEKEKIDINEFEEMKETKQKYEGIVKSILQNIEEIKTKYPYNKKEFLNLNNLIDIIGRINERMLT